MAVLFAAALMMWGCSEKVESGAVNSVSVGFALKGQSEVCKSTNEYLVADVNLYVADMQGTIYSHTYASQLEGVKIDVPKGVSCIVYAVANLGRSVPFHNIEDLLSMELSKELLYGGRLVMHGEYGPDLFEDGGYIVVDLVRDAAKITLKFNFTQLNSDVSIDVKRVTLKNIPHRMKIFEKGRALSSADVCDADAVYYPTDNQLADGLSFYMLENMQGTLQPGNNQQKYKTWPQGSLYSYICSYMEVLAGYSSNEQEGDIIYRYYLGKDICTNYDVERNTHYTVNVSFKGNGGVDENSWRVDTGELVDVVQPYVEFCQEQKLMYDLEEGEIAFANVLGNGELKVEVSDPEVMQIVSYDRNGVRVKALSEGSVILTASLQGASASCSVEVQKLRVVPRTSSLVMYNHFYEDIEYDVFPEHASAMKVVVSVNSSGITTGYNGVPCRVIPQISNDVPLPFETRIVLTVEGRDDVRAEVPVVVKPMLKMAGSIIVNANMGSSNSVKSLGLECSPRASVEFGWAPQDGDSVYGDPGSHILLNEASGSVTVPVPSAANGTYRLVASVNGDDGYGHNPDIHTDAISYCDITVYETIYLVGVSKTMGKERVSADPQVWKYTNEVVAKWLSHPKSLLFPNGEVNVDYGFVYNGITYNDSHTEFQADYTFTFIKGEPIYYALDSHPHIFNGNVPEYYIEYFYLQPAVSPYINGNMRDGTRFLFICSLQFFSGFSDDNSPEWNKIFEFIYK